MRSAPSEDPARRIAPGWLGAAVLVYLALSLALAWTKAPWCDEGSLANSSYNLAFHGYMGSNVIEPGGHFLNAYLRGIHRWTYIVTPNQLVAIAGWFKVFGATAFNMRAFSILWGVVTILAMYRIALRMFPDRGVAQLAAVLTSLDWVFQWITADGRPESLAMALAACSLAAYLHFRERDFRMAVITSQTLLAAAMFTHPNALLVGLGVFVVAVLYDRKRLRLEYLLWTALPYLIFAALWGAYILQSPSDFKAQFFANAAGRDSARWKSVLEPWNSIRQEVFRQIFVYVNSSLWSAETNHHLILVAFMYLGANIWFFSKWRRHEPSVRIFSVCAATVLCGLTFLNGFKADPYMIYVMPFYDTIFAALLVKLWRRNGDPSVAAVALTFIFVVLQLWTAGMHILADEYHRDYLPTVRELARDKAAGKSIVATAALGFGLDFNGFADDWRLGLYSNLKPDVIVLDRSYRDFTGRFLDSEPAVYPHTASLLFSEYRLRKRFGSFWIFDRIPGATYAKVDTGPVKGLTFAQKRQKVDEMFDRVGGINTAVANGSKSSL